MQFNHKSLPELEADLATMERTAAKTASVDRRRIFNATAATIREEIARRKKAHTPPPAAPAPQAITAAPPPPSRPPAQQSAPARQRPVSPPLPGGGGAGGDETAALASPTIYLSAILEGATPKVCITWGDGSALSLTEGDARSRFITALRDLTESRNARRGRLNDIRLTRTYSRAKGYYRALAAFWRRQPTARELEIAPMSRLRTDIFDMIAADTAAAPQTA